MFARPSSVISGASSVGYDAKPRRALGRSPPPKAGEGADRFCRTADSNSPESISMLRLHGHETECASLRLRERSDDAGRALGMPVQRLDELVSRHAGLERTRLEVGGDQGEGVVVRRARGRAGAEIMRQTHQALAADVFLGLLGDLALGKAGHRYRN